MRRVFLVFILLFFVQTPLFGGNGFTQKDRELLIELKVRLKEIDKRFEQIDRRFEQIDKRFEQIDKRFEQIDKRFEQIDKRFEQIDKRFEQVDRRFLQIERRFEQVDRRIDVRISELRDDMNERFRDIITYMGIMAASFVSIVIMAISFALWDRRTMLRQAKEETISEIEKEGRIRDVILALRDMAKKYPELAEILRAHRLL